MHVTEVPLSMKTYDSVVKIHGMVLEKDVGMGLCLYVDLCFHASSLYLVRIHFGKPSLHLFTFLMFF